MLRYLFAGLTFTNLDRLVNSSAFFLTSKHDIPIVLSIENITTLFEEIEEFETNIRFLDSLDNRQIDSDFSDTNSDEEMLVTVPNNMKKFYGKRIDIFTVFDTEFFFKYSDLISG